jgi:hypothetical protein
MMSETAQQHYARYTDNLALAAEIEEFVPRARG